MYVLVPEVAVLMFAGLHVPLIPLIEVNGSAGAELFWQSGPIAAKEGVVLAVVVTVIVVPVAHCPAPGVKV